MIIRTPYLIAIAGPSCGGKTELSRQLARRLQALSTTRSAPAAEVPILPLDSYYLDLSSIPLDARARHNFDVPGALDLKLFSEHLRMLAAGQPIARPIYDFKLHARSGGVEIVRPEPYVVVEGLMLLHIEEVRNLFGTRVYVDLDEDTCLRRRIVRDVAERGRTPDSVRQQFAETVQPMAKNYIYPSRRFADVVVRGDDAIENSLAAVLAHIESGVRQG